MKLYVSMLNFNTTSDDLREVFEQFGEVASVTIIYDQETDNSKGMAFVEMPNDDEAQSAINTLNEADFDGNTIFVKEARDRENGHHDDGSFGGGSGGGSRGNGQW
jgi:RNA recognition motif-containing protein